MTKPDDLTTKDVEIALRNKLDQKSIGFGSHNDTIAESLSMKPTWGRNTNTRNKVHNKPKYQKDSGASNTKFVERRKCYN